MPKDQDPVLEEETPAPAEPAPTPTPDAQQAKVDQQLQVVTQGIEVSLGVKELTTDFKTRCTQLVATAKAHTKPPTDDTEQAAMLKDQRALASLRIEVEKQADALKAPLNAARTRITDLAKEGIEKIVSGERHIQRLVNARQQKLLQEKQKAEEEAERERKRLEQVAADAKRAEEEAERKRIEAERLAEAGNATAAAQASQEAQRLDEEATQKSLKVETAIVPVAAPVSTLPTAKSIKDFRLLGKTADERRASLIALAQNHPELFTLHASEEKPRSYTLTLRISDIDDRLNGKSTPFQTKPPGIEIFDRLKNLR